MHRVKSSLDVAMMVMLVALMCYLDVGARIHEYLGMAFFALFIIHNLLNLHYFRMLGRGRFTPARVAQLTVVLLCLVSGLLLCIGSFALIRFLPMHIRLPLSTSNALMLHDCLSCWMFVFMAVHIGQCVRPMVRRARLGEGTTAGRGVRRRNIFSAVSAAIVAAGIPAFISLGFPRHLAFRVFYVSLGVGMGQPVMVLALICTFAMFVMFGYWLQVLLARWHGTKPGSDTADTHLHASR